MLCAAASSQLCRFRKGNFGVFLPLRGSRCAHHPQTLLWGVRELLQGCRETNSFHPLLIPHGKMIYEEHSPKPPPCKCGACVECHRGSLSVPRHHPAPQRGLHVPQPAAEQLNTEFLEELKVFPTWVLSRGWFCGFHAHRGGAGAAPAQEGWLLLSFGDAGKSVLGDRGSPIPWAPQNCQGRRESEAAEPSISGALR